MDIKQTSYTYTHRPVILFRIVLVLTWPWAVWLRSLRAHRHSRAARVSIGRHIQALQKRGRLGRIPKAFPYLTDTHQKNLLSHTTLWFLLVTSQIFDSESIRVSIKCVLPSSRYRPEP
ncbi:hypothetical protein EVAR_50816_1 [Eumeta japonica]|uniref:Uncharacterized protein n=1 Tax=Eumeta variegata TaxID=151549 RepID=A0A4C1XDE3_EUMVA|nr:hypothetical protein EVAR_50816_1 [Eumeta japonica]